MLRSPTGVDTRRAATASEVVAILLLATTSLIAAGGTHRGTRRGERINALLSLGAAPNAADANVGADHPLDAHVYDAVDAHSLALRSHARSQASAAAESDSWI